MGLQSFLMSRLIENSSIGKKIQSGSDISKKGQFALDATEKNPNIENSLAEQIANLENETKRINNSIKKIVSLPNGATTGDGQIEDAKVGIEGESYDTLGDAIRNQIKTYRDVDVSNATPTGKAKVWVNTADNNDTLQDIVLPQVDDNNYSEDNTWSSRKIRDELQGRVTNPLVKIAGDSQQGYYSSTGFCESVGHKSSKVDVEGIDTVYVTGSTNGTFPWYVFLNGAGAVIEEGNHETYDYINAKLNVPDGAKYLGINCLGTSKSMGAYLRYDAFDPYKFLPFKDKLGIAIGDDITETGYYIDSLTDYTLALSIVKDGVTGATITNKDNKSICARVLSNDFSTFDFVLIEGGTNDYGGAQKDGQEIGTIDDSSDTTVYGALNKIVEHILTSNPSITILMVTATHRDGDWNKNNNQHNLSDYNDAIKNIGEKFGIPVLDLYAESGLTRFNLLTFTTDKVYWNALFSNKMGKMIADKFNHLYTVS